MALIVGEVETRAGDITQLKAIGAKAPVGVEKMLGYGAGRLSRGYYILLLKGKLEPHEFEFGGNTLNSGGKTGLPRRTPEEDERRSRVHSHIRYEYGDDGYVGLQKGALKNITPTGPDRLAKIVPVTEHSQTDSPADQYPMGGGSLQWRLRRPGREFLVAAFVDARAEAQTPTFKVSLAPKARYEERARLYDYLISVVA